MDQGQEDDVICPKSRAQRAARPGVVQVPDPETGSRLQTRTSPFLSYLLADGLARVLLRAMLSAAEAPPTSQGQTPGHRAESHPECPPALLTNLGLTGNSTKGHGQSVASEAAAEELQCRPQRTRLILQFGDSVG